MDGRHPELNRRRSVEGVLSSFLIEGITRHGLSAVTRNLFKDREITLSISPSIAVGLAYCLLGVCLGAVIGESILLVFKDEPDEVGSMGIWLPPVSTRYFCPAQEAWQVFWPTDSCALV